MLMYIVMIILSFVTNQSLVAKKL